MANSRRLSDTRDGMQVDNNGLVMKIESAEPATVHMSDGTIVTQKVKSGGTYGSAWFQSDGLYVNYDGTARKLPITASSATLQLQTGYDNLRTINVSSGALTLNDSSATTTDTLQINRSGASSGDAIEININAVTTGSAIDIRHSAAATGTALNISMTNAVGASAEVLTLAGVRTATGLLITDTSTGSAKKVNITVAGTGSGNVFEITHSAASTGDAIKLDMTSAVGAYALNIAGGNGARTKELVNIVQDGTGNKSALVINSTNTGTKHAIEIIENGINSGDAINVVYSAASTGNALNIDMTSAVAASVLKVTNAGARTVPTVLINDSSTGNTNLFDINMSGVYTGNIFDITFATAAATGNALKIAMGTNISGDAVSMTSAATGVTGHGSLLNLEHTGALVAGAVGVRLHSTGSPSSTSHLFYIKQDTGAGSAGAYGLVIDCSGANVEALHVAAGAVVLDETISVAGFATVTKGLIHGTAALSGAGAVSIVKAVTLYTSTGASEALTLADGTAGQEITVIHDVDGGSGILTPTTKTGYSTITFTNAGDSVKLMFTTTRGWIITASRGVTIG